MVFGRLGILSSPLSFRFLLPTQQRKGRKKFPAPFLQITPREPLNSQFLCNFWLKMIALGIIWLKMIALGIII
jgi:hypothetical protein